MARDKQLHLIVGLLSAWAVAVCVGVLSQAGAAWWPDALQVLGDPVAAALLGLLVGERAGWVKEYVWDAAGRGTVDRGDYLWTGRGAIAGALLGAACLHWVV